MLGHYVNELAQKKFYLMKSQRKNCLTSKMKDININLFAWPCMFWSVSFDLIPYIHCENMSVNNKVLYI